jgi:hypothetical protein
MSMRLFCKSIDDICKPSQSDMSMPILTRIFNSKKNDLVVASILLSAETSTGRKRTKDENGWNYIASIYEKMSTAKKKAERTGESLNVILAHDQERTRIQQANNRNRRKRLHSSNSTNDDVQNILQNAPAARRLPAAVDLNPESVQYINKRISSKIVQLNKLDGKMNQKCIFIYLHIQVYLLF